MSRLPCEHSTCNPFVALRHNLRVIQSGLLVIRGSAARLFAGGLASPFRVATGGAPSWWLEARPSRSSARPRIGRRAGARGGRNEWSPEGKPAEMAGIGRKKGFGDGSGASPNPQILPRRRNNLLDP